MSGGLCRWHLSLRRGFWASLVLVWRRSPVRSQLDGRGERSRGEKVGHLLRTETALPRTSTPRSGLMLVKTAPTAAVLRNNTTASVELLTNAATTSPFPTEQLLSALLAFRTLSFNARQETLPFHRPMKILSLAQSDQRHVLRMAPCLLQNILGIVEFESLEEGWN